MSQNPNQNSNPLFDDIFSQPKVLRRAVESVEKQIERLRSFAELLRDGRLKRVIFTGMGGSLAAGYPAALHLIGHGIDTLSVEASELIHYYKPLLTPQTLIVAVSQSGRSVEILRLLDEAGDNVPIIGVTNEIDSPLATRSRAYLRIAAGVETAVSTKTYTCTLVALRLLAAALTEQPIQPAIDDLRRAIDTIEAGLSDWERIAEEIATAITPVGFAVVLGRGGSRASAMAGALIIKETAKIPTEGMVGGQFRHGPLEVVAPGVVVVIFMGNGAARELNLKLARDLVVKDCKVICVGHDPVEGALHIPLAMPDDAVLPLVEIVPIQLLAAKLAAARGIEPGTFFHGTKVTTVE